MGLSTNTRAQTQSGPKSGLWLAAPAIVALLLTAVVPIGFMVVMSFWTSSIFGMRPGFSLDNYARLISDPLYLELLLKTTRIAAGVTLISLMIAYPMAMFLSLLKEPHRSLCVILLFLPFWTSYVVRTFAWLPILGTNGLINGALISLGIIDQPITWLLYNEFAVYVGLVYVYLLFMALPIYLALDRIDRRLIEAAQDLGATRFSVFRRILFPLTLPGVLSGCVMVFLLAFGAFVTPSLLGGPSGIMYGNVIAAQFMAGTNWAFGAALSLTMIVLLAVLIGSISRWIGVRRTFLGETS